MPRESSDFAETGYRILPRLLAPADLAAVRALVAAQADAPAHEGMDRPGASLHPLRWNNPIVAAILTARSRMDRLRDAIGVRHLFWQSAYISSKPPRAPALAWHQDWWCWNDPISRRTLAPQVALLCYLGDCDRTSGALRLLPGSHTRWIGLHPWLPEPHSDAARSLPPGHPAVADHPEQVTAAVAGGDAVLIDYRLLHGTHRNDTGRRRDCILLSFLPEPDLLPRYVRAHLAMHPALPNNGEQAIAASVRYSSHIARFDEKPRSLVINRVPPTMFG